MGRSVFNISFEQERAVGWAFGHAMIWEPGDYPLPRPKRCRACRKGSAREKQRDLTSRPCTASPPAMDFLRDGEIYRDGPGRSELGTTEGRHARAHRPHRSEFPPVIPRRVASQQSPLPLHRIRRWNQGCSVPSSLRQFQYRFPHAVERTGREVRTRAPRIGASGLVRTTPIGLDEPVAL